MKATEEFNQDFRPKTRSKQEEEVLDISFFPNYDDPVDKIRRTCIKHGLPIPSLLNA